jgi:3D (Asp-Asp-Asp) domain-containing protein
MKLKLNKLFKKIKHKHKSQEKMAEKMLLAVAIVFLLEMVFPQHLVVARNIDEQSSNEFPQTMDAEPLEIHHVIATAYSSTVDQCDDTPFITANNTRVRDGIIAANFLPFGTRVKIPKLYGDKEFVVTDRMNKKYEYRIDIWMETRQEAIDFGAQYVEIEVYGSSYYRR